MVRGMLGAVRDRDPPQLDVIFRRNADFGMGVDSVIAAAELGAGLREDRLVTFARLERWLPGSGPKGAAVQIAQIAESAEAIARGVFPPARHGQIAPAAVTAARTGDDDMVSAVGKQMDLGDRSAWVGEDPHRAFLFGRRALRVVLASAT